jgi:hypothetical protein
MFPIEVFTAAVAEFEATFPDTLLSVHVESLDGGKRRHG